MNRREFIASSTALALTACASDAKPALPPGELLGASPARGHRLLAADLPAPGETRRVAVLIVGGGIAGLSAAWRLAKAGFEDFALCEMEPSVGGNARWGENAISAHPWGAHYLPLPTRECRAVRELLADLGVLQGDPQASKPRYDERYLCATPQERLFRNGLWQDGVMPQADLGVDERSQLKRFGERMAGFKLAHGRDGRKAFALPIDLSSRDPQFLDLDRQSMRDWLLGEGYTSEPLHWYVDYACRDDYGTRAAETSAWAGIHYFASRDGEALDTAGDTVITAPEGNGWIVRALAQRLASHLHTGLLCRRIAAEGKGAYADFAADDGRVVRYQADSLIWAAPAFLLPKAWLEAPAELQAACKAVDYAPWLVANLSLSQLPEERRGAPLSWDNVLYNSESLGYVVATHQQIRRRPGATVLTYYRALADGPSALARQSLLATTQATWAERILAELERVHPNLRAITTRLDICRWGHAMARPRPGTLWHGLRTTLAIPAGSITLAHADLSGLSLFEEANYRGVMAAEATLKHLGVSFATIL